MEVMSGMIADKTRKIKRKMEELNMKIIGEETEMATATADCEKNKDALKGMEEPLGSEADRIIAPAQMMSRKFMSSTTVKRKRKRPKRS
jgi:5,10-methylenetetrahydrofolate reductase